MQRDAAEESPRRARWKRGGVLVLVALGVWLALAYLVLPALWTHHEHDPDLAAIEPFARTPQGIPGDAVNVVLRGTEEEVIRAFHAIGWSPADPITLRSSARIVESVMLDRPYVDAPVSTLLWAGRPQALAFERAAGRSADERHHVRFWPDPGADVGGRPRWIGAATFDRGVGLSHRTGQVTHHIAPDVDAERDAIVTELQAAHLVERSYAVTGVGPTIDGRNGGGDRYCTDGEIAVVWLTPRSVPRADAGTELRSPPFVVWKDRVWPSVCGALDAASTNAAPP